MKRYQGMLAGLAAMSALLAGCGIQAAQASQYLHVEPGTSNVYLKVVSGFSNNLAENTIDGVPAGDLTITVPKGSVVHMKVTNDGPMPETFGVYDRNVQLAFNGSGDPWYSDVVLNAVDGLATGQSQTYTFTASRVGSYTLADLLNGATNSNIPVSNIWETLKVVPSGRASLTTK